MIFVDTSAFFALADRADDNHERAKVILFNLAGNEELFTHNYIIVESVALMQRRLGMRVVRKFLEDMNNIRIYWISREFNAQAVRMFLRRNARSISLVDYVSFEVMKQQNVSKVFAFDIDFKKAGFKILT